MHYSTNRNKKHITSVVAVMRTRWRQTESKREIALISAWGVIYRIILPKRDDCEDYFAENKPIYSTYTIWEVIQFLS